MKKKILDKLYANQGRYISGEELKNGLGISRTAVWKHINSLKEEGYTIETAARKGYRLLNMEDKLLPKEIEMALSTEFIGKQLFCFETIDSTNNYAKKIGSSGINGTVILSEEQQGGRGRRGQQWTSPKGEGIWMSILLKPPIPPMEGMKITQIAAAAVCQSIRKRADLEALIKWPNDIVVNGKKVCGILTEMAGELNEINYLVVGIGINVNNHFFPEDLREKATSLMMECERKIDRKILTVDILECFEKLYQSYLSTGCLGRSIEIIRSYSAVLNQTVRILQGKEERKGRGIAIDDEGFLIVQYEDGSREKLSSGELSIRGEKGYI